MTKGIKITLIAIGFVVLMGVKIALDEAGGGGMIWAFFLMGYIAYARAIWKHRKKSADNTQLDKTV